MGLGTAEVNDADVRIEVVLPWLLQRWGKWCRVRSGHAHRFFWKKEVD